MASDLILDENSIIIKDVDKLVIQGNPSSCDLILDSIERRPGTNQGDTRRALVHDGGDILSINYHGDYLGGTVIFGGKGGAPVVIKGSSLCFTSNHGENISALEVTEDNLLRINHNSKVNLVAEGDTVSIDSNLVNIGIETWEKGSESCLRGLIVNTKGNRIECNVKSICLTNQDLYLGDDNPSRVAFVHSDQDELVINQGQNYKGGVKIEGNVEIKDSLSIEDWIFNNVSGNFSKVINDEKILQSPTVQTIRRGTLSLESNKNVDVNIEFQQLREELNSIKNRLSQLEHEQKSTPE